MALQQSTHFNSSYPWLRRCWLIALIFCLGCCTLLLQPTVQAAELSAEQVQQELDDLDSRKLTETEHATVQQLLEQTLSWLKTRDDYVRAQQQLSQQLATAPEQIRQAEQALQRFVPQSAERFAEAHSNQSIAELEQALEQTNQQLNALQKQLSDANSLVITTQTRPERAQAEVTSIQARIQEINTQLKAKETAKTSSPERQELLQAELQAIQEQSKLRRAELDANNQLQELGSVQRDLYRAQLTEVEQQVAVLQELVNTHRQRESQQAVEELSLEISQAGTDTLLVREGRLNLQLSDYLLMVTERRNDLTQRNLKVRQQLETVQQTDQALEEQISVLQGSLLLAKILYQQQQALPSVSFDRTLAEQIADMRLYQFELRQFREKIREPERYVDKLLGVTSDPSENAELRGKLLDTIKTRNQLLDKLSKELNALLSEAINLQLNQKQLKNLSDSLRATLAEQMFWIPSNKPLDASWLQHFPENALKQLEHLPLQAAWQGVWQAWVAMPWLFIGLAAVVVVLLALRPKLNAYVQKSNQDIGHFRLDGQLHTPKALLITMLYALPVSLLLAGAGWGLGYQAEGVNRYLGEALLVMAQVWLVFSTLARILKPHGIAEVHFRWLPSENTFARKQVRGLLVVMLMMLPVVIVAQYQPAILSEDVLGLSTMLVGLVLLSVVMTRLILHSYRGSAPNAFKRFLGLVVAMAPLGLVIATSLGYYYTSLKLTGRLFGTLSLFVVWLVLEATVVRGLAVAARRLAWQRSVNSKVNQPHESSEVPEVVAEPQLDISQINEQSLRLARLILWGGFFISLYWLWADLLSVFTYLDNISLYQNTSGSGDAAVTEVVSLRDGINALLFAAVTFILARNLPGLLEVMLLSRMKLAQGSSYATTTLLSYCIVATGTVATLASLGVSWDKLQWLVAALSLGLGFGLQEIFANFVSGIIILFERPVRIGDLVTIRNISGTVSRIRIRATTITDFDRKELIIPNKVFVTDQLMNWSLSDTVTRLVVKIGLAYETDLVLARKLMQQVLQENQRVLRDPEPGIYFTGISASTFDYELRYYVRDLGDRSSSMDEILTRLVLAFRDNNIDMAFNQLDVFIKNQHSETETHLASTQLATGAAGSPASEPPRTGQSRT